jgi:hypothetical protein
MTTQVLSTSGAHLSNATVSTAQPHDQHPIEETAQISESPNRVAPQPRKLPYQASHQVELMHLQAETEALLQRLQTLKQQRQSEFGSEDESHEPSESNLVASC